MDEDVLHNLDESVRSLLEWGTAPIILLLSIDLNMDTIPVNITETMVIIGVHCLQSLGILC